LPGFSAEISPCLLASARICEEAVVYTNVFFVVPEISSFNQAFAAVPETAGSFPTVIAIAAAIITIGKHSSV
jgi:hypothetical protein